MQVGQLLVTVQAASDINEKVLFGTDSKEIKDELVGGNKADYLFAGVGNDTLKGEAGNDCMEGGVGFDFYHILGKKYYLRCRW